MAVDKLSKKITPEHIDNYIVTGSSTVEVLSSHFLKFGGIVIGSVRTKIKSNTTSGMSIPFAKVPYAAVRDSMIPSMATIMRNGSVLSSYADLVGLQAYNGGTYYLVQQLTNNLQANDTVEMYFAYETNGQSQ